MADKWRTSPKHEILNKFRKRSHCFLQSGTYLPAYFGLKGQDNIAQPNGLGKEIGPFLALKGQNKERAIILLLRSASKMGTLKTQGVAMGSVYCTFGAKLNHRQTNPKNREWLQRFFTTGAQRTQRVVK